MPSIAVVGGGIAGLTAAYRLHRQGIDVTLFEAEDRIGGVIRSERVDGYLIEHGPNSIQARSSAIEALVDELELTPEVVEASPAAKQRYVVRAGRPVPLPSSPPAFLTTPLFSVGTKLGLLREPFVSPARPEAEETVADFVRRRLGRELLDYAINPFVAGIFAGDPERLSLRHAFPRLHALEQQYGSLIRGQIQKSKEKKRMVEPGPSGRMFSFREGLRRLPEALAAPLGEHLRTGCPVVALRRRADAWELTCRAGDASHTASFDAVVVTTPLHRLPEVSGLTPADRALLEDVSYAPVRVIFQGYRRAAVEHPLDGFGMLVPAVETQLKILGTLFSSTLFPNRAPDGHVLLTTFVGGTRRPELAGSTEAEVHRTVGRDLGALLGIRQPPIFERQVFWPYAIPQYEVGYGAVMARLDEIETGLRGLILAGSFRQGISVSDTVASGEAAAQRALTVVTST